MMNTASKRASAMNPWSPWRGLWPQPDGSVGKADRWQVAFAYAGLAFDEPGCLHTSDAAVWSVTASDAVIHQVTVTDAAVWAISPTDRTC